MILLEGCRQETKAEWYWRNYDHCFQQWGLIELDLHQDFLVCRAILVPRNVIYRSDYGKRV